MGISALFVCQVRAEVCVEKEPARNLGRQILWQTVVGIGTGLTRFLRLLALVVQNHSQGAKVGSVLAWAAAPSVLGRVRD